MTRPPPEERPSARQLAAKCAGQEPMQIAGKPADVCPYCGAGMFVTGTRTRDTSISRYVACRNCGKRFVSRQPKDPGTLIREIDADDESSSSGHERLTIHRDAV